MQTTWNKMNRRTSLRLSSKLCWNSRLGIHNIASAVLKTWNNSWNSLSDSQEKRRSRRFTHLKNWNALNGMLSRTEASTTDAGRIWARTRCQPFSRPPNLVDRKSFFEPPTTSQTNGRFKADKRQFTTKRTQCSGEDLRSIMTNKPSAGWPFIPLKGWITCSRNKEDLIDKDEVPHEPNLAMHCWEVPNPPGLQGRCSGLNEPERQTKIHRLERMRDKPDSVRYPACVQFPSHQHDLESENSEQEPMFHTTKVKAKWVSWIQFDKISQWKIDNHFNCSVTWITTGMFILVGYAIVDFCGQRIF